MQHARILCNMLEFCANMLKFCGTSHESSLKVKIFMVFILGLQFICGQMFKIYGLYSIREHLQPQSSQFQGPWWAGLGSQPQGSSCFAHIHSRTISRFLAMQHAKILSCGPPLVHYTSTFCEVVCMLYTVPSPLPPIKKFQKKCHSTLKTWSNCSLTRSYIRYHTLCHNYKANVPFRYIKKKWKERDCEENPTLPSIIM